MCSLMTGFALAVIDLVILTLILIFYTPVVLSNCHSPRKGRLLAEISNRPISRLGQVRYHPDSDSLA